MCLLGRERLGKSDLGLRHGWVITSTKIGCNYLTSTTFVKPPLKLWHDWVITSHVNQWMWLRMHAIISVKPYAFSAQMISNIRLCCALCPDGQFLEIITQSTGRWNNVRHHSPSHAAGFVFGVTWDLVTHCHDLRTCPDAFQSWLLSFIRSPWYLHKLVTHRVSLLYTA